MLKEKFVQHIFVSGQEFHGLEKLNLNGEHIDPSVMVLGFTGVFLTELAYLLRWQTMFGI